MAKPWLSKSISLATAKNLIGEPMYLRIHPLYPRVAGTITGMILDAKTIEECDALLEDDAAFSALVEEAVSVLKEKGIPIH